MGRDYRQRLKPYVRWMPWSVLVCAIVLTFPISMVLGLLIGAWSGIKEAARDHCGTLRMVWRGK